MPVQLNHTIVHSHDRQASAQFWADLLGLDAPVEFGPFRVLTTENEVSLDFMTSSGEIASQHYAFLISEVEFDAVFERIAQRKVPYWADPYQRRAGQINEGSGRRSFYFEDPNGHLLEVLTRPYGEGA